MESDSLLNKGQYCHFCESYQSLTDDGGTFAKNSSYLSSDPTSALLPSDLIRKKGVGFVCRSWWIDVS